MCESGQRRENRMANIIRFAFVVNDLMDKFQEYSRGGTIVDDEDKKSIKLFYSFIVLFGGVDRSLWYQFLPIDNDRQVSLEQVNQWEDLVKRAWERDSFIPRLIKNEDNFKKTMLDYCRIIGFVKGGVKFSSFKREDDLAVFNELLFFLEALGRTILATLNSASAEQYRSDIA